MNTVNLLVSITVVAMASQQLSALPSGYGYAQWQPLQHQQMYGFQGRSDQDTQASIYDEHSGGGGGGYDYSSFGHSGGDEHQESYPVSEHVEVSKPELIPEYKHIQVPIHKPFNIHIPHPILVPVPHPYPIQVPVNKPVVVPVIREITIPIEKVVPYPVEKKVPYPVEKRVPYTVEKHITVHVDKPYPVKIPYIKTIYHSAKGHGGHGGHGWH